MSKYKIVNWTNVEISNFGVSNCIGMLQELQKFNNNVKIVSYFNFALDALKWSTDSIVRAIKKCLVNLSVKKILIHIIMNDNGRSFG